MAGVQKLNVCWQMAMRQFGHAARQRRRPRQRRSRRPPANSRRDQRCWDRQLRCPACRRRGGTTGAPSTAEAMYVFPPLQAIPLLQSSQGTPDLSSSYWRSLSFAPWLQIGCEEAFSFLGKRGYRSNTAVRKQDLASVAEREDAQSDERTAMLRQPRCPSFAPERMVCRYGSCATPTKWVMAELSPFW